VKKEYSIVLFDGVCNLCNDAVLFIIRRDKKEVFKFASLQSNYAVDTLKNYNHDASSLDSIVLLEGQIQYIRSTAVLKILKRLTWYGKLLYIFMIVPTPIRDAIYDFIAKRRYKWFEKKEACLLPTSDLKNRFLES
jgi:predicted DCC family thiol-disulfide oxidoreductase YuxK